MMVDGFDRELLKELKQMPPECPSEAIRWFESNRQQCERLYESLVPSNMD
jgi:hypothetical protein